LRHTANAAARGRPEDSPPPAWDKAAGRAFPARHWSKLAGLAGVVIAGTLLYRTLGGYSLQEILASIAAVPLTRLAAAAGFAAASYACLTGFDYLALRYAGRPLAYRKAALASFTSLSLGHNIGFAALSSGAIRYRFYSRWGLAPEDVVKVVLFCAATVGLGLMALVAAAFLIDGDAVARLTGLGRAAVVAIGCASLVSIVAYISAAAVVKRSLTIRTWRFRMPSTGLAVGQVAIGGLNFACVAASLHQTIAAVTEASYPAVAAAYAIANTGTLLAHAPGGLGVIEAVVIHLLPGSGLIGAVLVFRFVYYLAPLALGVVAFGASELVLGRTRAGRD